jgi:hypothetical protein
MVPGNEELKAYKDEVTNIKKADTNMEDGSVYDNTKQDSKLFDSEGMREGPAYLEVGLKSSLDTSKD